MSFITNDGEAVTWDENDPASLDPRSRRYWAKVSKEGDGECWRWTGAIQGAGYGVYWVGKKCKLAHRLAYTALVGPIPAGLVLDHLCRNRWCVNPAHLEPVTDRVNIHRSPIAKAAVQARRTHCPSGHEYAGANLIVRGKRRFCRQCQSDRDKRRSAA